MKNGHAWWRKALQGRFDPVAQDAPQPGLYWMRERGKILAVQIDQIGGAVIAWVNGERADDACHVFSRCGRHPVTAGQYQTILKGEWKPWNK